MSKRWGDEEEDLHDGLTANLQIKPHVSDAMEYPHIERSLGPDSFLQRNRRDTTREKGIVCLLKEKFGFIKCVDRDGDIFFHFSECLESVAAGDEVEFSVHINDHSRKVTAVDVVRLRKGTIIVHNLDKENWEGLVVRCGRQQNASAVARNGNRLRGEIEYKTLQGSGQEVSTRKMYFTEIDLAEPASLVRQGDFVQFAIVRNSSGREKATSIKVLKTAKQLQTEKQQMVSPRETGVISSIKESFGFIKCAERELDIYFHFSDLEAKSSAPHPGNEVSFHVVEDVRRGRNSSSTVSEVLYKATDVRFLAAGSIIWHEIMQPSTQGTVQKLPREARSESNQVGLIRLADDKEIAFRSTDIKTSCTLMIGDIVSLAVIREKRSSRLFARDIVLTEPNSAERDVGVVSSLKEQFGFISCLSCPEDIYFRLSEVLGDSATLAQGAEVSFSLAQDRRSRSQDSVRAQRIVLLKPGSVQFEVDLGGPIEGYVIRKLPRGDGKAPRQDKSALGGMISFQPGIDLSIYFPKLDSQLREFMNDPIRQTLVVDKGLSPLERAILATLCEQQGLSQERTQGGSRAIILSKSGETRSHKSQRGIGELKGTPSAEDTFTATFSKDDLQDRSYIPELGDSVQFFPILERRQKLIRGRRISFLRSGTYLDGVISTIKDSYGFIMKVEGNEEVFFHVSEIVKEQDTRTLRAGDEVSFQEIVEVGVVRQGVVTRGISQRAAKREKVRAEPDDAADRGFLIEMKQEQSVNDLTGTSEGESDLEVAFSSVAAREGEDTADAKHLFENEGQTNWKQISFGTEDISKESQSAAARLLPGDEVTFTLVTSKSGKRRRAVDIKLVKRRTFIGVVETIRRNLFIRPSSMIGGGGEDTTTRSLTIAGALAYAGKSPEVDLVSFVSSDVTDGSVVESGDQVQYSVVQMGSQRPRAVDIKVIQKGFILPPRQNEGLKVGLSTQIGKTIHQFEVAQRQMKKAGIVPVVNSHMAKGPDGTNGFPSGWRRDKLVLEIDNCTAGSQ